MADMRRRDYLKPINVDANTWCYAERRGLCVVHQVSSGIRSDMFYLPWRTIGKALRLKQQITARPKRKRK